METRIFCQSCGMPMDSEQLMGTEKDGSLSNEYCRYCYWRGSFTEPDITIKEMTMKIIGKMEEMHIDSATIDLAVLHLPDLKRWKQEANAH